MNWFERLTGIEESSPDAVRSQITLEGTRLRSHANGRSFEAGNFEMLSLGRLRARSEGLYPGRLQVREIVADVTDLHADPDNAGALFQAASQFNMLEMVHPYVSPEKGIGRYEKDHTQGPACAIACGAGTIFRNYLVPVQGRIGQSRDIQIDGLSAVAESLELRWLGRKRQPFWRMTNGYALMNESELTRLNARLQSLGHSKTLKLMDKLEIGLQADTQVLLEQCTHLVSQAYVSALPISYCGGDLALWEPFARLILGATYEATLRAGVLNMARTGNPDIYLTLIGGGAFGNPEGWILDALLDALDGVRETGLRCHIVSYSSSNPALRRILDRF